MCLSRPPCSSSTPLAGGTSSEVIVDTQPASKAQEGTSAWQCVLAGKELCPHHWAWGIGSGGLGGRAPENTVRLLESKLGQLARDIAGVFRPLCVCFQFGEGLQGGPGLPPTPGPRIACRVGQLPALPGGLCL